jgi:transposase InsO family protein
VAATKAVELVDVPLRMALWQRDRERRPIVPGELICHADAGSQYTSLVFTEHLADEGIRPSIGSVGDAFDNALMECVIGLYKTECIRTTVFQAGPYRTISHVEYATAGWVDWYNNRRLHSSLGYTTPVECEATHYATLNREPQPA